MGPAVAVALLLLAGTTASAAPAPDAEPVAPVETKGTDPVLDDVPVVETGASRAADGDYQDASFQEDLATLRALGAEQERTDLVARLGDADGQVVRTEAALVDAGAVLDAEEEELAERKATQKDRRADLAVQQGELRRLAAGVLMSAPADDFAWLGDANDINVSGKREALRDRGVEEQSARVEAAQAPWEEARQATEDQQDVVDDATAARKAATEARDTAIAERDDTAELLTAAEALAATRVTELATAAEVTHEAAVTRRTARLTALVSGLDLRLVALDAYWRAAGNAPCTIPWWVLAGVGKVETRHGTAHGSSLDAEGNTTVHILGIALDGRPGVAAIGDTDGGALDGDGTWDRAVGPMQFIPGTWRRWATDGNADGTADPHNIYDAAAAAAAYLCFGRGDLSAEPAQRGALLSYNQSVPYGTKVLGEGRGYRAALDLPDRPQDLPDPTTTATAAEGD